MVVETLVREGKDIIILTAVRAVTAAGTPEKVKEAPEQEFNKVLSVTIRSTGGNAGDVYVTNEEQRGAAATQDYILAPGETITLDVHDILGSFIDLSKLWIDAANSGDSISYIAFEVV